MSNNRNTNPVDIAHGNVNKKVAGVETPAPLSGPVKGPTARTSTTPGTSSKITNATNLGNANVNVNNNSSSARSTNGSKEKDKNNSKKGNNNNSAGNQSEFSDPASGPAPKLNFGSRPSSNDNLNRKNIASGLSPGLPDDISTTDEAASISQSSNKSNSLQLTSQQESSSHPADFTFDSSVTQEPQSTQYTTVEGTNLSLQSSPALSAMTDFSGNVRGDKQLSHPSPSSAHKTISSSTSRQNSTSTVSSSNLGGSSTVNNSYSNSTNSNRDRSASIDKKPMNNNPNTRDNRDRNNAGQNNRYSNRGVDQNQNTQYHHQGQQQQQQSYMNRTRSGSQPGMNVNVNQAMSQPLQQQQQMMHQIPHQWGQQAFDDPNHFQNQPQYFYQVIQQPQHQQAHMLDPRFTQMIPNPQGVHMAPQQQQRNFNNRVMYNNAPCIPHFQPQFSKQHAYTIDSSAGKVPYPAMQPSPHGVIYPPQRIHVPNSSLPLQMLPNSTYMNVPAGNPLQQQHIQQQSLSPAYLIPPGGMPTSSPMNIPVAQPVPSTQMNSGSINVGMVPVSMTSTAISSTSSLPPVTESDIAVPHATAVQVESTIEQSVEPIIVEDPKPSKVKRNPLIYKTKSGEVLDLKSLATTSTASSTGPPSSETVIPVLSQIHPVGDHQLFPIAEEPDSNSSGGSPEESSSAIQQSTEKSSSPKVADVNTVEKDLIDSEVVTATEHLPIAVSSETPVVVAAQVEFSPQDHNILVSSDDQVTSTSTDSSLLVADDVVLKGKTDNEPIIVDDDSRAPSTIALKSSSVLSEINVHSNNTSNANSRNASPRLTGMYSDEANDLRAKTNSSLPPAVTAASSTIRSKKSHKKDIYAAADAAAAAGQNDILSAYKEPVVAVPATPAEPPSTIVEDTNSSEKQIAEVSVEDSLPDNWEDGEIQLPKVVSPDDSSSALSKNCDGGDCDDASPPIKEVPARSLRPGGTIGLGIPIKLNKGPSNIFYTRDTLLSLKPSTVPAVSTILFYSGPISIITETGGFVKGHQGPGQGGQASSQHGQQQQGSGWGKQQGQHRESSHSGKGEALDSNAWERDRRTGAAQATTVPPSYSQQQQQSQGQQYPVKTKMPLAKKTSDPMELLTIDVKSILNKITPQTFEKLSEQMLHLNVTNTAMLDKVIGIIFDKALDEPNFTQLYAELCSFLNKEATNWVFYTVVKMVDGNQYFWIKDFAFDNVVAGPYLSRNDCISSVLDIDKPPMKLPTVPMEVVEVILENDILMKLFTNNETAQFFVTYVPFSDVAKEKCSEDTCPDLERVKKQAKLSNNFRSRLVTKCQEEFEKTTKNESIYCKLEKDLQELLLQKSTMSPTEFALKEVEITDEQGKLKRRMLGNIRFVGELYKQQLLSTKVMNDCIRDLLGSPEAGWKEMKDEQDIELLCKLLTTVGQTFEEKSNTAQSAQFNEYFSRMQVLSKDKSLNARMRFSIEEVISLRSNKWQSRREHEGPLKISEIHQRIQQEEERNKMIAAQQHHPLQQQQGPKRGGGDIRQMQQQQQQQQFYGKGGMVGNRGQQQYHNVNDPVGKFYRTNSLGPAGMAETQHLSQGDHFRRMNTDSNVRKSNVGYGQQFVQSPQQQSPLGGMMQSQHQHSSHSRDFLQASAISFTDDSILRRVKGLINEYLTYANASEIVVYFSESRSSAIGGYFVIQLIKKCIDSNQLAVCSRLTALLQEEPVIAFLSKCKLEVEAALRGMEEIKMLFDTVLDCSNAPELIAAIARSLVDIQVIPVGKIYAMINEFKEINSRDDMYSVEEGNKIFERFLQRLNVTK